MASKALPKRSAAGRREPPREIVHEVQVGDTFDAVCGAYAADPGRVRRANGIPSTSDYLGAPGSRLRIPEGRRPPVPVGPTEDERRATLLRSFRLRHGLSAEDAGVFLRLAGWDADRAEAEFRDVEADHAAMGPDAALGAEAAAVPGAATAAAAAPGDEALPDVGLGERWQSQGVVGSAVVPADGLRRRRADV